MAVKCQKIISCIEEFAPKYLAEEWDNVGLQVGTPSAEIDTILVALDVNKDVVDEAVAIGAQLIVSHHPLFFKPIHNLRFNTPFGSLISTIIKNDLNVYSAHTNLDSSRGGVNAALAEKLGLQDVEILNPDKQEELVKLVVFIPASHAEVVREAITKAGAGFIGNYSDCTFMVNGTGTFRGLEGTNPFIGETGTLEKAEEIRLETVMPKRIANLVVRAMLKAHPYEEVAYDLYPLINTGETLGIGRIGILEDYMTLEEFCDMVKGALDLQHLKVVGDMRGKVKKIALCGGSGAGFIKKAHFLGADLLLTGDVKYHEAQEAEALGLNIVDAGHNGTEALIVPILAQHIADKLSKDQLKVHVSKVNTDPFEFI